MLESDEREKEGDGARGRERETYWKTWISERIEGSSDISFWTSAF